MKTLLCCVLFFMTSFALLAEEEVECCYFPSCDYPAYSYANPCCFGLWEFNLAALYWCVNRDDKLYTLTETITTFETNIYNIIEPKFSWGVRGGITYTPSDRCRFAHLEYTYFDAKESDGVANPVDNSYFQTPLRQIDASVDTKYQRLMGHLGFYLREGCCGNLYAYGGASWIYVKEMDRIDGFPTSGGSLFVDQELKFSGAGFEFGVGGEYKLLCGLGIAGKFNGVAGIGRRSVDFEFTTASTVIPGRRLINDRPTVTQCFPGLDMNLELFYELFCDCFISVGYEYHHFFNLLIQNRLYYFNGLNDFAPDQYQETVDRGFGGLYIEARVGF